MTAGDRRRKRDREAAVEASVRSGGAAVETTPNDATAASRTGLAASVATAIEASDRTAAAVAASDLETKAHANARNVEDTAEVLSQGGEREKAKGGVKDAWSSGGIRSVDRAPPSSGGSITASVKEMAATFDELAKATSKMKRNSSQTSLLEADRAMHDAHGASPTPTRRQSRHADEKTADDASVKKPKEPKPANGEKEEARPADATRRGASTSSTSSTSARALVFGFLVAVAVVALVAIAAAVVVFDRASPPVGLANAPAPVLAHHAAGRRVTIRTRSRGGGGGGSETSVFVREAGPKHGEAVVLVHGSATTSFVFRALVDRLADRGVRAIAFDFPGHGLSAARGDPAPLPLPTDARLAAYVDALASTLRLPPHHVVVMEDAAGVGVEYVSLTRNRAPGGSHGIQTVRSLSFLEPQLRAPSTPCAPAGLLTLPLGLGRSAAASPLLPAALARSCGGGAMSPRDAESHAFLLRVDGALRSGLQARRSALAARSEKRSAGRREAFLLRKMAFGMPADLPKQVMWSGEAPTPEAAAQAFIVQALPGVRQTHSFVTHSAPWAAEPGAAVDEVAETIDAFLEASRSVSAAEETAETAPEASGGGDGQEDAGSVSAERPAEEGRDASVYAAEYARRQAEKYVAAHGGAHHPRSTARHPEDDGGAHDHGHGAGCDGHSHEHL